MGAKEASKRGVSHLNWVWEEVEDMAGGGGLGGEGARSAWGRAGGDAPAPTTRDLEPSWHPWRLAGCSSPGTNATRHYPVQPEE